MDLLNQKREQAADLFLCQDLSEVNLWDIYKITSEGALKPKCPDSNENCIVGANMERVLCSIFFGVEEHMGEYLKEYTIKEVVNFVNKRQ